MGKKQYSKEVEEKYERIIDGFAALEVDRITVMTGSNGSGKSLIRKQLPFAMQDRLKLETPQEGNGYVMSTSMDARTGSRPDMGALSGMMRDTEWVATSQNTYSAISGLFNSILKGVSTAKSLKDRKYYIVIDEFEIGCSEETILALIHFINDGLKSLMEKGKIMGAMIITHSRLAVKELVADDFINLDGMTKQDWINREVVATDLKKLDENELFFYIRDNKQK